VKIIDASLPLKRKYGTLVPIEEVQTAVVRSFGAQRPKLRKDDIGTAVRNLARLGSGYSIVEFHGRTYLKTSTYEFDDKGTQLLDSVGTAGWFDTAPPGMNIGEFTCAVLSLITHGLVWVDKGNGGNVRYYVISCFPDVFR
jgi:hypothetical protein